MATSAITVFTTIRWGVPGPEHEQHAAILRSHDGFPSHHGRALLDLLKAARNTEGGRLAALFVDRLFRTATGASIELYDSDDVYRHCQDYTYRVSLYDVDGIKRTYITVREEITRAEKKCKSIEEFEELLSRLPVGAGHLKTLVEEMEVERSKAKAARDEDTRERVMY